MFERVSMGLQQTSVCVCVCVSQGQASEARLAGCFPVCVFMYVCSAFATSHVHSETGSGGAMYYSYEGWGDQVGGSEEDCIPVESYK